MSSLTFKVLRNVLSNRTDFCCLCFKSIEDVESCNINDEVVFDKSTVDMNEVLSIVLGDHVLDNIPTHHICLQCSQIAIKCFKFIQKCRNNTQSLLSSIASIQTYTKHLKEDMNDLETLILIYDPFNHKVKSYFDKTRISKDPKRLFERIKTLRRHLSKSKKNVSLKRKINCRNHEFMKYSEITKNENLASYKCKLCFKLCSTRVKFMQHYLRVHAPKDYKCPKCPSSFGLKSFLTRHIKDSHCSVVCSKCGKIYTNIYSLRHHEKSHNLHLACHTCGKVYKAKHRLNNHINMKLCKKMRKSNAEAQFSCDYCHKKYAQKGALSAHIRLEHVNEKVLTCQWCNKNFATLSQLNDHIIKHTKQKKHECDQCGRQFGTKVSLLYHTRLHTGEKPYKCEHCEMSFLSASRRLEHMNRYHTFPSFECDICHRKYNRNACLTRHRKRHFVLGSKLYCKPVNKINEKE